MSGRNTMQMFDTIFIQFIQYSYNIDKTMPIMLPLPTMLTMFQKANVPVLGMIENMSYWSCPDCGRIDHIFGEGGVKAEAKKRGIEMLGEIPISSQVRKSSDSGIPIIISEPKSVQSKNYRNIAKAIIKSVKIDEEELV